MAIDSTTEFDLGPLSWVQGEIDQALARGLEALNAFRAPPHDASTLKHARTHIHQAAGAIQMVGLDAVVVYTDEIERQLAALEESGDAAESRTAIDAVDRACRKLQIFLAEVVNGTPPAPLKLFPEYEVMQRARGLRVVAPTDLFYPDLSARAPKLDDVPPIPPAKLQSWLVKQRRTYQRGLLDWLRGEESGVAAMREAVGAIEHATTAPGLRAFWWTTGAVFDAVIHHGIDPGFGVKQLAARIDLQVRRVVEGSGKVADRLRREVLYFVAVSAPVTPSIRAVQAGYRLAGLIPSAAVMNADLVRLQPLLREAREQLGAAKDAWLKFASGRAENLPKLKQTMAAVHRDATEVGNGALMKLTASLVERLDRFGSAQVAEPLAMEYATGMLLAESAFENYANLAAEFPAQVEAMLARLDAAQAMRPVAGTASAPLLDEMSKRAQERVLLAQVGREIQANLRHMEQILDAFFRDHSKRAELGTLRKESQQIRGALQMLDLDVADELLALCQTQIETYANPDAEVSDDDLEMLAEALSGLGFYIEAVEQQRPDRDRLIVPLLARRRGEAPAEDREPAGDSAEAAVAALRNALPRLVEEVHRAPADVAARDALRARLSDLRSDAELIGDSELVAQAASALAELDSGGGDALAATVTAMADTAAPMPEISEETQRLLATDATGLDAELLEIYLAEASEVLDTIGEHRALLAANPGDREALRTIRRGFHTLKGSGRMVGLMDLGEVAYDVEKIHNRLLEEERPVTRAVQHMIEVAQRDFRQWVDALSATGKVIADPGELHAAIRAVEFELPGGRESVIKSVAPQPVAGVVTVAAAAGTAAVAAAVPPVERPVEPTPPQPVSEPEPVSEPVLEFAPIDFAPGADLGTAPDDRLVTPDAVGAEPAAVAAEFDLELPELGSGAAVIEYTSVADFDEVAEPTDFVVSPASPVEQPPAAAPLDRVPAEAASFDIEPDFGAIDTAPIDLQEPALESGVPLAVEAETIEFAPIASEVIEFEAVEPEVAEPEVVEPEVVEPEVVEPEVVEPEVVEPEVVEAEVVEAEAIEPEVAEPEVVEPEAVEAEAVEAEAVEAEAVEAEAVEAEAVEAEAVEAEAVEAEAVEAEAVEAEAVEAEAVEAEAVEAEAVEAEAVEAEAVEAEAVEAEAVEAEAVEAEAVEAEAVEAEAVEAEAVEAEAVEAEAVEAEAVEAEAVEAEAVEAEAVEPEAVEAEAVEAEAVEAEAVEAEAVEAEAVEAEAVEAEVVALPASVADEVTIGGLTLSTVLFGILMDEADQHLGTLGHELSVLQFDPSQVPSADMVRASHTLCGIHRTGGFPLVATLAKALELCLTTLRTGTPPLPAAAHPVIARSVLDLEALVSRIKALEPFTADDEQEVAAVRKELEALADTATSGAVDAEMHAAAEAARDDVPGEAAADAVPDTAVETTPLAIEPIVDIVEPVAEVVEPVAEVVEPVVEVVEPVAEVVEPIVEIVEPVAEVVEPVAEVVEPVAEVVEPVAEVVEPVAEVVEPVAELVEPVAEVVEPVAEVDEPVAEVVEPVAEVVEPVAEVVEPVAEVVEPVAEVVEPVAEVVEPVAEVVEPVAEVVEPVAEVVEPVAEVVEPVAEVVEPVAELVEPVAEVVEPVAEVVEPVAEVVEPVAEVVEPVAEVVEPVAEVVEPVAEVVEPATEALAAPPVDPLAGVQDDVDEQVLPIFLEEAAELFPRAGDQLRAWMRDPEIAQHASELRRTLHTFKGSARMAGAMRLGQLTHLMESRLLDGDTIAAGTPSLFEALNNELDTVSFVLDELRAGRFNVDLPWVAALAAARFAAPVTPPEEVAAPAAVPVEPVAPVAAPATEASVPRETAAADAIAAAMAVEPQEPVAAAASPAEAATPAEAAAGEAEGGQRALLRVRADIIDRLVNEAGEVSIARARVEGELRSLKSNLLELTNSVIRLRREVRELEIQGESQIQSRMSLVGGATEGFDPLELDRFTRFQELTRSLAEGVNDVSTVQQSLLRNLDDADAALVAQARLSRDVQQQLFSIRTVPFGSLSDRLYRILRRLARELDKRANLEIRGAQVELDRAVLEKLVGPLEHLLRNALDHGLETAERRRAAGKPETGEIALNVRQVGNEIAIELTDDGCGLDLDGIRAKAVALGRLAPDAQPSAGQLIEFIFQAGFSTARAVTQVSGRGIGMDVVRSEIAALGGRIEVTTNPGRGTSFLIYLPLTLAVAQAVLVRAGGRLWALPAPMVEQVLQIKGEHLLDHYIKGKVDWQHATYPFHYLPRLLGDSDHRPETARYNSVLLLRSGQSLAAVHVDEMVGKEEVVVKNIGPQLARVSGIAGATVLGSGEIVLIINPVQLAQRMGAAQAAVSDERFVPSIAPVLPAQSGPPLVMVVDDSLTVRKITSRLLLREGFKVTTAKDGVEGLEMLAADVPDVILLDIEMPRMDGFEFTRNLKADPRLAHIPIIMITSRMAEKHRERARELGVDLYLGKPYQEEELVGTLRDMLALTA